MSTDRIVMYIVIPTSLKMGVGKVGATCGHAVQLFMDEYHRYARSAMVEEDKECVLVRQWLESSYAKIVLGASDSEFANVRKLGDLVRAVTVIDVGLKQVPAGSITAVGFWPMLKSSAPSAIRELELLR